MSKLRKTWIAAALLCASFATLADVYGDVDRLIRAGKQNDALAVADKHLAGTPRDPRMRLLKGVALTEASRTTEAITVFAALTEDYPELPEPHNNLGVLHASQDQLERARAALEAAVRTSPKYATALENLGDVHARMAADAYGRARGVDENNSRVRPKLALMLDLVRSPGMPAAALSSAPAFGTGASAAPVLVSAPQVPTAAGAADRPHAATAVADPARSAQAMPRPVSARASETPSAAQPTASAPSNPELETAVTAWATSWSTKDLDAYFTAYAPDFKPAGGLTRAAWEEQRRQRILGKNRITVKVTDLTVSVNGDAAVARFKQDYVADALVTSDRKTLEFERSGGRWLIVRESVGF